MSRRRRLASSVSRSPDADPAELLAAAVRVFAADAPRRVEGACSWVCWDGARSRLLAVRDRLGLEPLFWAAHADRVAVGPDPAELLRVLGVPAVPDPTSVVCHLNGQAPPDGASFYAGVHAVEPGTAVVFARHGVTEERYWRLEVPPRLRLGGDGEYAEALRALLIEVCADHAAGGPAAVSMSGGLDSTSVAATLRAVAPDAGLAALHRCTPDLPQADESAAAHRVAVHLGLRFEPVRSDLHWPLSGAGGMMSDASSPLCPPYAEAWDATWSRAAEMGISVVHTGAGGDHLFGGSVIYPYADLLLAGRWRRLAGDLRRHARSLHRSPWGLLPRTLLRPLARAYLPRWRPAGRSAVPWLAAAARRRWRDVHGAVLRRDGAVREHLPPALRDRLRFLTDARTGEMAVALGRLARRRGLELRHPLLDPRLFAFALSLPAEQSYAAGVEKAVLRRAMAPWLPAEHLARRGKVFPFAILHRGLRERQVEAVRGLLSGMRSADAGWVDEARLGTEYERYRRGDGGSVGLLWNALTLEAWLRRYFP